MVCTGMGEGDIRFDVLLLACTLRGSLQSIQSRPPPPLLLPILDCFWSQRAKRRTGRRRGGGGGGTSTDNERATVFGLFQLASEMLRLFDPTLEPQPAPPSEPLNLIPIYRSPRIVGALLPGKSLPARQPVCQTPSKHWFTTSVFQPLPYLITS